MIACYILYSPSLDKFYIGFTQEGIEERLQKYNDGVYGQRYSSITNDWEVFHVITCQSTSQAKKIENHVKRMKSKIYIQNLKNYPEMTQKLLHRYV